MYSYYRLEHEECPPALLIRGWLQSDLPRFASQVDNKCEADLGPFNIRAQTDFPEILSIFKDAMRLCCRLQRQHTIDNRG